MMSKGGGGSSQTASKDPWGPAVEPLTNSLATGQDLERYYQQNPFNRLQQQGYQNLYSDIDQFRNQIAPGLMNFANGMMTSNYQRGPRNSQVESMQSQQRPAMGQPQMMQQMQSGGGQQGQSQGGGLLGALGQAQQGMGGLGSGQSFMDYLRSGGLSTEGAMQQSGAQGLLSQPGVFQHPSSGSYGLLDFNQLNPFTSSNGIPAKPVAKPGAKTPEDIWAEEAAQRERDRLTNYGGS